MPLVQKHPLINAYLVYEAPVDEKTKKVREMFKVDEETGYPEHYNWRSMARLGKKYEWKDPYEKFDPFRPEEYYTTKIISSLSAVGLGALVQFIGNYMFSRPWYAKPQMFLGITAFGLAANHYYHEWGLRRQAIINKSIIEYTQQHPDRFPPLERQKFRETLHLWYPVR